MNFAELINREVSLVVPRIHKDEFQTVIVVGVESGGIWIESQKMRIAFGTPQKQKRGPAAGAGVNCGGCNSHLPLGVPARAYARPASRDGRRSGCYRRKIRFARQSPPNHC